MKKITKPIAINGYARGGKTTSARIFQILSSPRVTDLSIDAVIDNWKDLGFYYGDMSPFTVVSFADPLRSVAEILTGVPADSWRTEEVKNSNLRPPYENFTGREFLEHLGTEVLRNTLHKQCHIAACDRMFDNDVIFDDLRMENEAEYIKSKGGTIIQIVGRGYRRDHESGELLDEKFIDHKVDNSKSISYLAEQLKEIYNAWSQRCYICC